MPRQIVMSIDPARSERLAEKLGGLDGVLSVKLERRPFTTSDQDSLTVTTTNQGSRHVLHLIRELELSPAATIATTELRSLHSPGNDFAEHESNETIWEEMGFLLRRETNLNFNYLALMALSGAVAAAGLATDTLHIVIGAMVLAPGFEPLLRISFGFVAGPRALGVRGILSSLAGYAAMAAGAALALLLLQAADATTGRVADNHWVRYWSSTTVAGVTVSTFAALAGAVVVAAQRSVLTAGAMIALALVPSASIAAMAGVLGDARLLTGALGRWSVDVVAVTLAGAAVLAAKYVMVHHRASL